MLCSKEFFLTKKSLVLKRYGKINENKSVSSAFKERAEKFSNINVTVLVRFAAEAFLTSWLIFMCLSIFRPNLNA